MQNGWIYGIVRIINSPITGAISDGTALPFTETVLLVALVVPGYIAGTFSVYGDQVNGLADQKYRFWLGCFRTKTFASD